jgi:hypothetical protein
MVCKLRYPIATVGHYEGLLILNTLWWIVMELLSLFSGMWCSVTEYLNPTILKESSFIFKGLDAASYFRKMKSSMTNLWVTWVPNVAYSFLNLKRIATFGMRKKLFWITLFYWVMYIFFYFKILVQSVYDCRSYLHRYSVCYFTLLLKNLLVIWMGTGAPFPRPEADHWPPCRAEVTNE